MTDLTHFDSAGRAAMVDVSAKPETERVAIASGRLYAQAETLELIRAGSAAKGDVLGVARLAGIMAAKQTGALIPLCHPLPLSSVSVEFSVETDHVAIRATCKTVGRTGVEMEAMTAVSVAGLTIYDMVKAVDRGMRLDAVRLIEKRGGRSGVWRAADSEPADPARTDPARTGPADLPA